MIRRPLKFVSRAAAAREPRAHTSLARDRQREKFIELPAFSKFMMH